MTASTRHAAEQASPSSDAPEAGWYDDPGGRHDQRYWNGDGWTVAVHDKSGLSEDPLPPLDEAPPGTVDRRAALPARAAAVAIVGFVIAQALAVALLLAVTRVAGHDRSLRLLVAQLGFWAALVATCWLVSRRYGTGNLRRDYGLAARG